MLDYYAIAQCTPGVIAVNTAVYRYDGSRGVIHAGAYRINAATYAGYTAAGMFGGLVATLGIICPSIIIISKIFDKFKNSRSVQSALYGIRPAVMGMIGSVSLKMIRLAVFAGNKLGIKELVLFVVLLATSNKIKLHLNLSVPCLIKSTSPFS